MDKMTSHRHVPNQAYRPRLYGDVERQDPTEKYDPANTGEIVYNDFVIRREPEYQLWQIVTTEGRQISNAGLHGMYTSHNIAIAKIDEYLKKQDEEAKNNQTSN
jgi:hypothetical protein